MTTTAPAPLRTEQIHFHALELLHPDPDNPRKKLRGIDELAASIEVHGILEPLTVRVRAEGGWWVVNGHRRLAAAQKARGILSAPCRLLDEEDGNDEDFHRTNRTAKRIVENLQRDDLSPIERATAFQQLFDLGHDEKAVAGLTGVKADVVKSAGVLARSKSALKLAEEKELTLDQAVAFAEFDGDAEATQALSSTLEYEPEYFDHALSELRQEREEAALVGAEAERLKAEGWTVVDAYPARNGGAMPIDQLLAKAGAKSAIKPEAHKSCPDAVVHIGTVHVRDGNKTTLRVDLRHFCLDPKSNGHAARYGSLTLSRPADSGESDKEREKRLQQGRELRACNKAARAAEPVRRAFVAELLKRKTLPAGLARYATETLVVPDYFRVIQHATMFEELTGKTPAAFVKSLTDARLPLALFAHVAAELESNWPPDVWRTRFNAEHRKAYLEFLVKAGYTAALVERIILGTSKPIDVLNAAELAKAGSKSPATAGHKSTGPAKRAAPAKKAVKRAPARKRPAS